MKTLTNTLNQVRELRVEAYTLLEENHSLVVPQTVANQVRALLKEARELEAREVEAYRALRA